MPTDVLRSPLAQKVDLVIPWVNLAARTWARAMGEEPARPSLVEVKYQLRSYQANGWLDHGAVPLAQCSLRNE